MGSFKEDHDAVCAQEVNKMYDLGCFEVQFNVFIISTLEENEIKYFAGSDTDRAFAYFKNKLLEQERCLPPEKYTFNKIVPSGQKETLAEYFKLEAAKKAQAKDTKALESIGRHFFKPNNSCLELMNKLWSTLEGCYDQGSLQIFDGLLETAFLAGKILPEDYRYFAKRIKMREKEMFEEYIEHDAYERTYGGFMYYDKNKTKKFYYNAVPSLVKEKRLELMQKGIAVTPIYQKRCCFPRVEMLTEATEGFKKELRARFDENYEQLWQYIRQAESPLDRQSFAAAQQEAQDDAYLSSVYNFYAMLWQVE